MMQMLQVLVISRQTIDGALCETENKYDGKRFEKDGAVILRYEEKITDERDAKTVVTTLTVRDSEVRLHRKGNAGADMIFRGGERCEFVYRTPFGNLPMAIFTKVCAITKDDRRVSVHLLYTLYSADEIAGDMELLIEAGV